MNFWQFCAGYPFHSGFFMLLCVWLIANVSNDICGAIRGRKEDRKDVRQ